MGRKKILTKLLTCLAAASTVVTGIFGSVPLTVRAAEEGSYTVTFEAYEGTCETESVSVPKGENIVLPDASYEGHYLESWVDVTDNGDVTKFTAVGRPGDTYTPERDLWLYANWKPEQGQDITVTYEARIGDTSYEELEQAFENAQAGDTIIVLRDCSVSKTLEVTADNITLTSEDAEKPVTIRREEEFAGKNYAKDAGNVLVGISSGSLATQDIILDGGAVLDQDFNNTGQVWDSPLIYVKGFYAMGAGTVLQNNYNTDYSESVDGNRSVRTAGAVEVTWDASMAMDGGLIQDCYTLGAGGGIQSAKTAEVTITSGTIRHCAAVWGGALGLMGPCEASDMELSGNHSDSTGGAVWSLLSLVMTDSVIENNSSDYVAGGLHMSTGGDSKLIRCTISGNSALRGSAIQTGKGEGTKALVIRDCTITGNRSKENISAASAICYMNETGIILSGNIVMEGNHEVGLAPCDIFYFFNEGASILLDEDFESDSVFVLGGYDNIKPGRVLIDEKLYHKDASTEQFVWHTRSYCTEKRGENIYLAEVPKTYFITYDANNNPPGSSIMCSDPNEYTSEDTAVIMGEAELFPLMGNLVYFGYDFVGWNTEADGSGTGYTPGQEISLTDNLYLYAQWEATPPVTMTYVYNGGTGETESEQAIPGANVAFPDASRKGYRFKGWYKDEELTVFAGSAGEKHYAPRQDASYYAAWEKTEATIVFDADGGEMEGGDITAEIGDTIVLPSCTKEDYEFTGWYDGDTCVGQAGEDYTVVGDVTLKAHYVRKKAPTCTVSFDTDGGKEIPPMKVEKGKEIKLPEAEREGHIFLGWYTAKEGGTRVEAELTVTEDTMLYARWKKEAEKPEERPEATITFDADGGEMEGGDVTARVGDTIVLPACTKEDYEFTGWYDGDICVGQAGKDYTVAGDVTLKAHYIRKEAPTCTVSFDTDGGKEISPMKVEKGKAVKLPEAEKEGHIFLGWYTAKEDGTRIGTELTVTEDTTLYARWEKEAEKPEEKPEATITFDADGGEMEGGDITTKVGDTIILPACTKEGYEFTGWYDGDTSVGKAGEKYTVSGDVILKAHYEKKAEVTYLITFDPNGGRRAEPVKAVKGEKIILPGTEKSGYVFLGWYTEKKGGILLGLAGDELEVAKDMTVYALWEKEKAEETGDKKQETCKVTFHTEGGSLKNKTLTIIKGAGLYLPLPEKKGYDFTGWYLDKSLTQFAGAYRDSYRITKDIDFYAKWEKIKEEDKKDDNTDDSTDQGNNAEIADTYTVKYDANGGTVKESSAKVTKGKGVKLPAAEREGYTFTGWYTDKQILAGKAGSVYKPEGDICLYAGWKKVSGGNSGDNTNDTGKSSGAKTGTSPADTGSKAGTGTSTADIGSGSSPDKKSDTPATGESGNTAAGVPGTGTEKEPVIQTGRTSPVYLLAAIGMAGVLLAAFSVREGKHSSMDKA